MLVEDANDECVVGRERSEESWSSTVRAPQAQAFSPYQSQDACQHAKVIYSISCKGLH